VLSGLCGTHDWFVLQEKVFSDRKVVESYLFTLLFPMAVMALPFISEAGNLFQ
jgi:hypothetical protein